MIKTETKYKYIKDCDCYYEYDLSMNHNPIGYFYDKKNFDLVAMSSYDKISKIIYQKCLTEKQLKYFLDNSDNPVINSSNPEIKIYHKADIPITFNYGNKSFQYEKEIKNIDDIRFTGLGIFGSIEYIKEYDNIIIKEHISNFNGYNSDFALNGRYMF